MISQSGTPLIHIAIKNSNYEMVKMLLEHGADARMNDEVSFQLRDDKNGTSPLSCAVFSQNIEICTLLLDFEADPEYPYQDVFELHP